MSKRKNKKTTSSPRDESAPVTAEHHPLHLPAHPPRPQPLAFFIALALFLLWFAYLVIVARWG
jgi:hypothetical protein